MCSQLIAWPMSGRLRGWVPVSGEAWTTCVTTGVKRSLCRPLPDSEPCSNSPGRKAEAAQVTRGRTSAGRCVLPHTSGHSRAHAAGLSPVDTLFVTRESHGNASFTRDRKIRWLPQRACGRWLRRMTTMAMTTALGVHRMCEAALWASLLTNSWRRGY